MNEAHILITLAGIHWIALMSPGPDFALILQSSTRNGRQTGFCIALGLSAGILTHSVFSLLGVSLILQKNHLLFTLIQIAGGGYLSRIGFIILWQFLSRNHHAQENSGPQIKAGRAIMNNTSHAFIRGYLTNLLNPKALVFFISLISGLIPAGFSLTGKITAITLFWGLTFIWFSFLAWTLSTPKIQRKILKISHYIDILCGTTLLGAGIFILINAINHIIS